MDDSRTVAGGSEPVSDGDNSQLASNDTQQTAATEPSSSIAHPSQAQDPSPARRLAINTAIVGGAFVLSRVLGLVREVVVAGQFGTSPEYDAYVAAFGIP